jgi:mannose-P-dolichol utilization defect 1
MEANYLISVQVFNYLAGSLSRIYTTLQEVPDPLILYSFVAGFILNAVLAAQMVYYWNADSSKSKTGDKRRKGYSVPKIEADSSATASGVTPSKSKQPSTRRRG